VLLTESALREMGEGRFPRSHWLIENAARLMQATTAGAAGSDFDRRFYLLAGLALHAGGALEPAHRVLLHGLRFVDERDPELLTALGAVTESVAALRQYDSPEPSGRPLRPGGYETESGGGGSLPRASLAEAQGYYERARSADPGLVEARLRFGRVRLLRRQPQAAIAELARVAVASATPAQRYLGHLFEGRANEAIDDQRGAAAAYRNAVTQVGAQTGWLALARALDRLGDTPAAQDALARACSAADTEDPWWDYLSGQPSRLDALLVNLRDQLRR
jgi:tetratricopeptide (TPR) repeat protein